MIIFTEYVSGLTTYTKDKDINIKNTFVSLIVYTN